MIRAAASAARFDERLDDAQGACGAALSDRVRSAELPGADIAVSLAGMTGVGVFAGYDNTKNMVVQVDEMSYWENPK